MAYDTEGMVRNIGQIQFDALTNLWRDRPAAPIAEQRSADPSMAMLGPFGQSFASRMFEPQFQTNLDTSGSRALMDMNDIKTTVRNQTFQFETAKQMAILKKTLEREEKEQAEKAEAAAKEKTDTLPNPQASEFGYVDPLPNAVPNTAVDRAYAGAFPHAGWIRAYIPDDLKNDLEFMNILAAGTHAESTWDVNKIQPDGGGRGLFQFDVNGGMGTGYSNAQLLGDAGARFQASKIVPIYADFYRRRAASGLKDPAQIASWVAAMAERPYQYQDPNSRARQNYIRSYNQVAVSNQQHQQAATQAAVVNQVTGGGFNPNTPAIKQVLDWTCSATSAAWLLNSMGIKATEQSVIQGMGSGRINSTVGLTNADGSGLVSYFAAQGIQARNAKMTFDQVAAMAGKAPLMIGNSNWYHWTGVAGVSADGNSLILANPAPGYKGVGQTLTRQQFAAFGGLFNGVWVNG